MYTTERHWFTELSEAGRQPVAVTESKAALAAINHHIDRIIDLLDSFEYQEQAALWVCKQDWSDEEIEEAKAKCRFCRDLCNRVDSLAKRTRQCLFPETKDRGA